jgi:hypothetical protein
VPLADDLRNLTEVGLMNHLRVVRVRIDPNRWFDESHQRIVIHALTSIRGVMPAYCAAHDSLLLANYPGATVVGIG